MNNDPIETPSTELPASDEDQLQAKYRRAFLEQLRRQHCPGCGESFLFDSPPPNSQHKIEEES